ncbi:NAD(P)/FAD-dependent oxidoreductase [Mycobacterium heckeshornense]|uniref:Putative monooxygenase n=1 Tax=Mycobacterium heckeshornense TaxID=110505 RepID=A0A2G8BGI5_9MYCO|nr:NAD(P)/FAD-dependent oxidoreductase [Mycobacterium heckeshornense]KMV23393.1 4-hydroxyacetophenone monooxygenase [Mycobacterium heckeshornense]MCV7032761.1 NAD(P)/FAD-dependent oxidoreductase [Mycobacterium heckeshornense]PIJ36848.1 NAD(P)/FAD-dependent oxidoreductase [Mycobacterium heckeshornense]BCO35398.1 putative monooxygenase [Mycobacterium heckeshornense]BCQ08553.1 putative monooxygenase [Mycobacterium heckeshornense]
MARSHVHPTLIVGAGFTGLGAAIKLLQAGVDDVAILERSDRVGGTWRDTTYPGASCDIPSLLYSYSFVRNPTWSRTYSPADEICRHIEDMATRFDVRRHIRFGHNVNGLTFDETTGVWTATTSNGKRFRARTVVLASGPLSDASFPDIRGINSYAGRKIHSARWDHGYDFTGKRVGVIGTGASAIQIIPELVKQAQFVKVFQRTPGWVLPRLDFPTPRPVQELFAKVPVAQQLARHALFWGHEASATALVWNTPLTSLVARLGKAHLRLTVKDPWLRRQLTPDFVPGCKRMLVSSDYYPALQRPNCKLIDWPIATLSPAGIRTSDGIEHHLDCIVFATGYDVHLTGPPFPVTGLGGRSLNAEWADGAQAYKSINVHGYPNLFIMTGPNSGPGHNSLLVYIEGQLDYAVRGITTILDRNLRYLDVRADVQRRHNQLIQKRLARTTWMSGCRSWYLTKDGFNASMYPGFATQYLRQMRDFRLADYHAVTHPADVGMSSSA